jgi:RNA polymerase sigma-70 factor (ECF subfamily)
MMTHPLHPPTRTAPAPTSAPDPDRQLHQRVRAGDGDALTQLVTAWWSQLKRWALWETGDVHTADDACQEAWLRLSRSATSLDPDRNVAGWLRTIVRSACRDLAARERRTLRLVDDDRGAPHDPDRELDVQRGAKQMVAAFAALTPRQREALDLVDRCGMSPIEAAEQMGVSHATIRALLHQGRHALRSHLLGSELHDLVRP